MATAQEIERLSTLLDGARRAVVFSGAGLSTESGIPDFRGPSGLWTKMKPIPFDEFVASDAVRQESWRRRFDGERTLEAATPNRGHHCVTALVERGTVACVVTQNVDGLHQAAGLTDEHVVELHGNALYARCLSCGERYELAALEADYRRDGRVGECTACGGIIKSATISFGQAMPEEEMARAEAATRAADLFVVLGSSLTVYPAAGFPEYAARSGTPLVIVNREETPLDGLATLVVQDGIGDVLDAALGRH